MPMKSVVRVSEVVDLDGIVENNVQRKIQFLLMDARYLNLCFIYSLYFLVFCLASFRFFYYVCGLYWCSGLHLQCELLGSMAEDFYVSWKNCCADFIVCVLRWALIDYFAGYL